MGLNDLLATMERRAADTPDSSCNRGEVSANPAPIQACTLDTPDTPQNGNGGNDAWKVGAGDSAGKANSEPLPDPAMGARRQRVLAMLAERPGTRYAVLTDTEADSEAVIVALAIRDVATCEPRIPRQKYDPFLLLELVERHGGTIH